MGNFIDLTGQKFGRWTVLKQAPDHISKSGKTRKTYWYCECECGTISAVEGESLRNGKSKSCGCLAREIATKHGATGSRLKRVHDSIIARCENPNHHAYKNYGGRGITMCDEWRNDFLAFKNWMLANGYDENAPKYKYTVDRILVDKGYCPNNCRLISTKEQALNRRDNRLITYKGETKPLAQWCEELGIGYETTQARLNRGWTTEDAFEKPPTFNHHKGKGVTFNGKTQDIPSWAKELGINRNTIYNRLHKGWSVEEALTGVRDETLKFKPQKIKYKGKEQTITEWARELGINRSTFYQRLKKGWSIEECVADKKEEGVS